MTLVSPMRTYSAVIMSILLFLLSSFVQSSLGQECTADGNLCDTHERCQAWQEEGECFRAAKYMQKHCPASCNNALDEYNRSECKDMHQHCHVWAQMGECEEKYNAPNMKKYCPKACGHCGNDKRRVGATHDESGGCQDLHENCEYWAEIGEWYVIMRCIYILLHSFSHCVLV